VLFLVKTTGAPHRPLSLTRAKGLAQRSLIIYGIVIQASVGRIKYMNAIRSFRERTRVAFTRH